jgi:AraC family transcriptional regulator
VAHPLLHLARLPALRHPCRGNLDRAAAALLLGDRSILEIALDSGFASHQLFTSAFLRRFGMTPRAYQTRARRSRARRISA